MSKKKTAGRNKLVDRGQIRKAVWGMATTADIELIGKENLPAFISKSVSDHATNIRNSGQ
jgi:hypothetical protein